MIVTDRGIKPEFWKYMDDRPIKKVGQTFEEKEFINGAKSLRPLIKEGMDFDVG